MANKTYKGKETITTKEPKSTTWQQGKGNQGNQKKEAFKAPERDLGHKGGSISGGDFKKHRH